MKPHKKYLFYFSTNALKLTNGKVQVKCFKMHEIRQQNTKNSLAERALPQAPLRDLRPQTP